MRETCLPGEELLSTQGVCSKEWANQSFSSTASQQAKKPEMKWKLLGLSITVETLSERNKESTSLE